jgi:hypothetical protein
MMVYTAPDYWAFGLCLSPDIPKNTTFRNLDLSPSSGEEMRDTYSVGSSTNSSAQSQDQ